VSQRRIEFISESARTKLALHDLRPQDTDAIEFLQQAVMGNSWLIPNASNYTFLVELTLEERSGYGIYKPRSGEASLWDFPENTLFLRECSSYEVSKLLGWELVPPTVQREGEYGIGSLQLYVPPIPQSTYFSLRDVHPDEALRLAVFDVVVNNADRKGGHCFEALTGGIWGIDHGLTFHTEHKLRTVIWDFALQPVPEALQADLFELMACLETPNTEATTALREMLAADEFDALLKRTSRLLEAPILPEPRSRRDVPWPLI
jgi:uncharacterized repeat protein (TIGR03843 family)